MRLETSASEHLHGAVYGQSRVGKTTLGRQFHEAGHSLLVVTAEPGPARRALWALDPSVPIFVPEDDKELMTFLEYPEAFIETALKVPQPGTVLFDNLQGLQEVLVGYGDTAPAEVSGVQVARRSATGIMRAPVVARSDAGTGLPVMEIAHHGLLEMQTRRMLHLIEQLPFHTLITCHEHLDSDQEHKVKTAGMKVQDAARHGRKVQGYPMLIGNKIRNALPGLVGDFYIHLTQENGRYTMWTQDHDVWKASPGNLRLKPQIDWTNKNGYAILMEGRA